MIQTAFLHDVGALRHRDQLEAIKELANAAFRPVFEEKQIPQELELLFGDSVLVLLETSEVVSSRYSDEVARSDCCDACLTLTTVLILESKLSERLASAIAMYSSHLELHWQIRWFHGIL